jgi:hypothetical protein
VTRIGTKQLVRSNGGRGILEMCSYFRIAEWLPVGHALAPDRGLTIDGQGCQEFAELVGSHRASALTALRVKPLFIVSRRAGQISPQTLLVCCFSSFGGGPVMFLPTAEYFCLFEAVG